MDRLNKGSRTMIQAWFLGTHSDLGGAQEKDGLSLYLLQWMIFESAACCLVMEFETPRGSLSLIDNPLDIIFPQSVYDGKVLGNWACQTKNKVNIEMHDLRKVHDNPRYESRYKIKVNQHNSGWLRKRPRTPFANGRLLGYCEFGALEVLDKALCYAKCCVAAQGTLIHPSVYLIFEVYPHVAVSSGDLSYRKSIEELRDCSIPPTQAVFWNEDAPILQEEDTSPVRILVCGNTGVGKSTLINEVFGEVMVHKSSPSFMIRALIRGNQDYRIGEDSGNTQY